MKNLDARYSILVNYLGLVLEMSTSFPIWTNREKFKPNQIFQLNILEKLKNEK